MVMNDGLEGNQGMSSSAMLLDTQTLYENQPSVPISIPALMTGTSTDHGGHYMHQDPPMPSFHDTFTIDMWNTGALSMLDPTYTMGIFCQDMVAGDLNDLLLNVFEDTSSIDDSGQSTQSDMISPVSSPHMSEARPIFLQSQDQDSRMFMEGNSTYYQGPVTQTQQTASQSQEQFGTSYTAQMSHEMPTPVSINLPRPKPSLKSTLVAPTSNPTSNPKQIEDAENIIKKHTVAFESSPMVWRTPVRDNNNVLEQLASKTSDLRLPERPLIELDPVIARIPRITQVAREKIVTVLTNTQFHGPWKEIELVFPGLDFFQEMLDSYFVHFHPQYPMTHLPTFNPNTALPHLLSAMIGIGTIWSCGLPRGNEAERATRAASASSIKGIGYGILECTRRATSNLV